MTDKAPLIIIGSGINALVAAAMLSRKGRKVLVLEREDRIGGCMMTDEITDPGFHHDVMAATFVLFLTGPAYGELAEDLGRHGLEFCHTDHPTAVLNPDGRNTRLTMDRDANAKAFDGIAKGEGAAYRQVVEGLEQDAEFIFALLGQPLWSRGMAQLVTKRAWKRGFGGLKAFLGGAMQPGRGFLETTFQTEDMRALLAPWVLHAGLTPEAAYSGQMLRVIAFALEAAGAPVAKGGAGRVADAFRGLIEANGGELRTGTDVSRIIVDGDRAKRVELPDGSVIEGSGVVASVAPGQLYGRLLGQDAPQQDVEALGAFQHGRGDFQLHYALDAPPDWIGEGLDDVALIHLSDGLDAVSKSCNEAIRGLLPETPTICVGQPSALDPSRCPEGKAVLWLQIPDAPRVIKGDAAGKIKTTAKWTKKMRDAYADRIEAILAAHIRNWDAIKLKRRAYSPADLEALNMNLVGGDPYGGQCGVDQFFVWRPFPHQVNNATAYRDLYHIGASTHPGPGLAGGSGYNLAKGLGA